MKIIEVLSHISYIVTEYAKSFALISIGLAALEIAAKWGHISL